MRATVCIRVTQSALEVNAYSIRSPKTARPALVAGLLDFKPGNDLLSHPRDGAVASALRGLTAVFGMGTGVTPAVWSPGNLELKRARRKHADSAVAELKLSKLSGQAERAISTGRLNTLLCVHSPPINQVVFLGPS